MPRISRPSMPSTYKDMFSMKAGIASLVVLAAAYVTLGFVGPRAQRMNDLERKFEKIAETGNPTVVQRKSGNRLSYGGKLGKIVKERDKLLDSAITIGNDAYWFVSDVNGDGTYEITTQTPIDFYPNPF